MARAAHTAYLSLGAQTVCPNNGDHRAVCVRTSHERAGFRARFDFRDDLPPCVLPPPSRADRGWRTVCITPQSSCVSCKVESELEVLIVGFQLPHARQAVCMPPNQRNAEATGG